MQLRGLDSGTAIRSGDSNTALLCFLILSTIFYQSHSIPQPFYEPFLARTAITYRTLRHLSKTTRDNMPQINVPSTKPYQHCVITPADFDRCPSRKAPVPTNSTRMCDLRVPSRQKSNRTTGPRSSAPIRAARSSTSSSSSKASRMSPQIPTNRIPKQQKITRR